MMAVEKRSGTDGGRGSGDKTAIVPIARRGEELLEVVSGAAEELVCVGEIVHQDVGSAGG